MPIFTQAGTKEYDFWLLDGQPNFSVIPANTIKEIEGPLPIRLQHGNRFYGSQHILKKHGKWVTKSEPTGCVATLLHRKLSQPGKLHVAEDGKHALAMQVAPAAFIVLRRPANQHFLTVVTMYFRQSPADGEILGRYLGYEWAVSPYVAPRW